MVWGKARIEIYLREFELYLCSMHIHNFDKLRLDRRVTLQFIHMEHELHGQGKS